MFGKVGFFQMNGQQANQMYYIQYAGVSLLVTNKKKKRLVQLSGNSNIW